MLRCLASLVIRLHGCLTDFLPRKQRRESVEIPLPGRASLKDIVESVGVPHPEVGAVRVDGAAVDLDYVIEREACIDVHPSSARPESIRFVADGHLGRLATYLRALGFDTLCDRFADDPSIAEQARAEARVVLTRDVGLLKRSAIRHGRWIRATRPAEQLREVVERYELRGRTRPFTRCMVCNTLLESRDKSAVASRVPPRSLAAFDRFSECPTCARVYWPGTHYTMLLKLFSAVGVSAEL